MPVQPVTKAPENIQDARGAFSSQPYENSAKSAADIGPLTSIDLEPRNAATPAADQAALGGVNFAQNPVPLNVTPITNALAGVQQDIAQADAQKAKLAKEAGQELANSLALKQEQEAFNWRGTGKGADGNAYSAEDLMARQIQEAQDAGVPSESYRAASSHVREIIEQKKAQDESKAAAAQKALDDDTDKAAAGFGLYTLQSQRSDRINPSTGLFDNSKALDQVLAGADLQKTPGAKQLYLEKAFTMLRTEAGKDPDIGVIDTQFTQAQKRIGELTAQGLPPQAAEAQALNELQQSGKVNPIVATMLNRVNGYKMDQEKLQYGQLQDKIATRESVQQLLSQGVDPNRVGSLLMGDKPLVVDPKNTDGLRAALKQVNTPQSLAVQGRLDEFKRDSIALDQHASRIARLDTQIKEAQDPQQRAAAAGKKIDPPKVLYDRLMFNKQIPPAALLPSGQFRTDVIFNNKLTDKGAVLFSQRSSGMRDFMLSKSAQRRMNSTDPNESYFDAKGNFTPRGARDLQPLLVNPPKDLYNLLNHPDTKPLTPGATKGPWQTKIDALQQNRAQEKLLFDSIQQKYQREDGGEYPQFPSLDTRLKGSQYGNGYKATVGYSPNGVAGGNAVVAVAMKALVSNESGGNYTAKNPDSSASGKYQYINSTWNNYGGYKTAASAPPSVQDARFQKDFQSNFKKYGGNTDAVALAHFMGNGVSDDYYKAIQSGDDRKIHAIMTYTDASGVSVATYLRRFHKHMSK